MQNRRIVVFGATGFIGRDLVLALSKDQRNTVLAFAHSHATSNKNNDYFANIPNVEIMSGDFFNHEDVDQALSKADYVFHLVSTSNPASSMNDPYFDIDTNLRGSVQLFELCVKHKIKRVIFSSSGGTVYGNASVDIVNEDTAPNPISPYGINKLAIEQYLRYFKIQHGLDSLIYRISNPYGPGQSITGKQGVIPIFLYSALQHTPLKVYGDGSMVRDYLFIDDLISMILSSFDKDHLQDIYNLGSGHGQSVNDIVDAINQCVPGGVKIIHQQVPPTFVQRNVLSIDRFCHEFNQPQLTPLGDGIAKTWESISHL